MWSSPRQKLSDRKQSGRSLFIADLHLTEERPLATGRFFHFLEQNARGADALYILGDLFEYWVGDDDLANPVAQDTARKLKALADSGTTIYFMHGNRDFLLAQRYAGQCGMALLADPVVIDLYGTATLLSHGDMFCTDDNQYQQYRRWMRHPLVQKLLLLLPLKVRHRLAGSARSGSERAKAKKTYDIMDVNQEAIARAFREYRVSRMIHGHTHRPARHETTLSGNNLERWVLPDWYGEGGYLVCTAEGCKFGAV
jgi:UDP-2,3-diacylglucosamine hydrolase